MMLLNPRTGRRLAAVIALFVTACATPQIATAETVPLPGGAAAASMQADMLNSTSCPAAGDCVSVGSYTDGSGYEQPLLEIESNYNWGAQEVTVPGASPQNNPYAYLD